MNFFEFLQQNWLELLALTREHLFLVFVSTGLAILFGVPLGILLTRVKSLQTPILGIANIMQTIPISRAVRFADSDSFYRRHRRENGDYRARALFISAGDSQHGDGNFGR